MNIKSILFSGILLSGILLTGCKEGEMGPEGARGDTGATGATGTTGIKGDKGATGDPGNPGANGNFNVIVKSIGSGEIGAGTNGAGISLPYVGSDLPAATVENSAVYLYLRSPDGAWYVAPGDVWSTTSNSWHSLTLQILFEENRTKTRFNIRRTKGTGTLPFTEGRLLLVPKAAGGRQANVDYSNYPAVKAFYHLED